MRITTTLALAFLATTCLLWTGCEDRSEVEPVPATDPAVDSELAPETDTAIAPQPAPAAEPLGEASEAPTGLEMPANATVEDEPQAEDEAASEPEPLDIGSQAPPLNIEHWLHAGAGDEPIREFEEGKVYVVEFWATWCQPCIVSMPHLAELQKEYADQGVRLISVSDERLQTVKDFLEDEVKPSQYEETAEGDEEEPQTYRELTSVYSLTTDPDRSTHRDYMEAANQQGIPTAFIVGKDGAIEWIGHPMTMDEPLQAVVNDEWDRDEFAKQMQLESQISEAQMLIRRGRMQEALQLINRLIDEIKSPDLLLSLKFFKLQALVLMEDKSDEVAKLANDLLDSAADRPQFVPQLTWVIYQATQASEIPEPVLARTIAAAEEAVKELDEDQRPSMLDTLAHLHESHGNLDAAIAAQQEAVELTEGRTKERLQQYLDELKAAKESGAAESEAASDERAGDATTETPDAANAEADPSAPVVEEKPADELPETETETEPQSQE